MRKTTSRIDQHFAPFERDHVAALRAEMERQGVDDPRKVQATNAGAYDGVKHEIDEIEREMAAVGLDDAELPLIDRVRLAQERVAARRNANGGVGRMDGTEAKDGRENFARLMRSGHTLGGNSARGKRKEEKPKALVDLCVEGHPQTRDVDACRDCGAAMDRPGEPYGFILQPALWKFVQNCKPNGLKLRDFIAFLTCTPYFTREQIDDVSGQIEYFRSQGQRGEHERGGERLFGEWPGRRQSERLLLSVEMAIERLGVRLKSEDEPKKAELKRTVPEELRQPTLRDVGNLACAVVLEHLSLLRGTSLGVEPGTEVPEQGIEALVTMTPDDLVALCDMISESNPRLGLLKPYSANKTAEGKLGVSHLDDMSHTTARRRLTSPLERLCAEMEKRKATMKRRENRRRKKVAKAKPQVRDLASLKY